MGNELILRNLPLWQGKPIVIKPLIGGITNTNFKVENNQGAFVARFAHKSNRLLGLDRSREIYNTNVAYSLGIGPRVVANFPKHNLLITEFISGTVFDKDLTKKPANIKAVAQLLSKLHRSRTTFQGATNIIQESKRYISVAEREKSWLPLDLKKDLLQLVHIQKIIATYDLNSPCHLDMMIENIIDTNKMIKLIDWEYSAKSDFRFDVAMFFIKADLNKQQEKIFFEAYGLSISPIELKAMKSLVYLREAAWGILQNAVSSISFDYKKYAEENLGHFRKNTVFGMK